MNIKREKSFIKDFSKTKLADSQFEKLIHYISLLAKEQPLPPESLEHALHGEYVGYREFHIGGDMLVIYKIIDDTLYISRLGTHAQLFE
ncbi:type II toxin-antitoxin system mRNA interferase toxin, RelE/StbE family [Helicobacter saguini]|uniref:Type II toxin-antitoxin system YafQ family toxin n=1 Tax=Helicobacter saguini TaxID=1548018 RepID=A0A347VR82_9HELI|nr:type II toxin-antitoxin system YafQ family toxin [Helicobacter saguini]MWV62998.1 type II toxin-antitoxin system mRNA interferase toxin, RelE/StbE family [Helicobacter saguini]MWV66333.1 type II toxin-antitoxin system mRNA interferase toxin, RelE/StbE family [Helicobacter saguini]MWV68685.1 type II toxin-antitoxin system mRNA interferase toxin, RelE/StbE family [Helicobacter saguini]MWV71764.1 type II toxin-antitoxin system mRNA interferase toxin, RelE/StbE family [Helicobacter saguini]TLD9